MVDESFRYSRARCAAAPPRSVRSTRPGATAQLLTWLAAGEQEVVTERRQLERYAELCRRGIEFEEWLERLPLNHRAARRSDEKASRWESTSLRRGLASGQRQAVCGDTLPSAATVKTMMRVDVAEEKAMSIWRKYKAGVADLALLLRARECWASATERLRSALDIHSGR